MCFHTSQTKSVNKLEKHYGALRNEQFDIEDSDFFHFHMNGFVHPELLMMLQESPFELHPSI